MELEGFNLVIITLTYIFVIILKGNKKGPVRRWDFDTDEEYSKYMENREALPKYVNLWISKQLANLQSILNSSISQKQNKYKK